jgi:polar amino acid transport system substrate-binding protein
MAGTSPAMTIGCDRNHYLIRLRAVAAAVLAISLWHTATLAQTPFVPDEWRFGKRSDGQTLHYCVDARDPDFPVARKIGAAIAQALLLAPREHVIGEQVVAEDLDDLYRVLIETCDVYLGVKLISEAYPEWVTITRAYYRGTFALVVTQADWTSLASMPRTRPIGSTIGTTADLRLAQYLMALREAERWPRFPMSSDEAALRALVAGKVGAALVWAPSLWALQRSEPAFKALRVIRPDPLPPATVDVGAAVLATETFLRSSLDRAIASLTGDGTIQGILDEFKFPGVAVR